MTVWQTELPASYISARPVRLFPSMSVPLLRLALICLRSLADLAPLRLVQLLMAGHLRAVQLAQMLVQQIDQRMGMRRPVQVLATACWYLHWQSQPCR